MALIFSVGAINVNSQNTNGNVSVGETQASGWSANRKVNNGQGLFIGLFSNLTNINTVYDPDLQDGLMNDQSVVPSFEGQQL